MSRAQSSGEGPGGPEGESALGRVQTACGAARREAEQARGAAVNGAYGHLGGLRPQRVREAAGNRCSGLGGERSCQGRRWRGEAERGGLMALAYSGLVRGKVAPTGPLGLRRDSPA